MSPIGLLQTLAESVRVAYVKDFLSLSLSENALLKLVNGKNVFPSNSFLKKKNFFNFYFIFIFEKKCSV